MKNYSSLPLVECYPGQLNQVFMNVLSNALDALETCERSDQNSSAIQRQHGLESTADSPFIRINTEVVGQFVVIRISDNGSGIPEAVKQRLFDPFFTTKPIGKGTGLGLVISHSIIDKHHGKISYHSLPGQGTEFTIEVPICQSRGDSPVNQGSPASTPL